MSFNSLSKSLLGDRGQDVSSSNGNVSGRIIYPARVINIDDPTNQNRIQARIVEVDENGNQRGGRDAHATDSQLPWCMPLIPEFLHIRPQVNELVWVMLENPSQNSSTRYWSGPVISSQSKLKFQKWDESIKMLEISNFSPNPSTKTNQSASIIYPTQGDVAIQGRDDADLILRPREAFLVSGKFQKGTTNPNTKSPCYLQLRQFDEKITVLPNITVSLPQYSQANLVATNINIYSPDGKFRKKEDAALEISDAIKNFGEFAQTLHPSVYGDELIRLLDLIIRVLLTHIHTPQTSLLSTPESSELQAYTIQGKLQNLISNYVRIN